jgi:hypothetical protein
MLEDSNSDSIANDPYCIDPNRGRGHPIHSAPFAGEHPQSCELGGGYRLERVPVSPASSGLYFDKCDCARESSDDVDFTVRASPTAIKKFISVRDEKVASDRFAPAPEFVFECHRSSPIRVGHGRGLGAARKFPVENHVRRDSVDED